MTSTSNHETRPTTPQAPCTAFQLDYAVTGQRRMMRYGDETTARATFDEVEAAPCTDWIALTTDADTARGYRVISSRGGPGMPDRFRAAATVPLELIGDLAGTNRITRDLLMFAWDHRNVTDPAGFSWPRMLAHVPEGVTGAVNHFLDLIGYLQRWEQPHNLAVDMKLRYSIVEVLWRLQHTDQPCLSCTALADSVDDIRPADGLVCTDCRRAA